MSKEDWILPPHKDRWWNEIRNKKDVVRKYNSLEKYVESIENQITELENKFLKDIGYETDGRRTLKNPTDREYFLYMIELYSGNYLEEKKELENEIMIVRLSIHLSRDKNIDSLTPYLNDLDKKQKYIDKLSKKDEEVIKDKCNGSYEIWCDRNIERWYKPEELV